MPEGISATIQAQIVPVRGGVPQWSELERRAYVRDTAGYSRYAPTNGDGRRVYALEDIAREMRSRGPKPVQYDLAGVPLSRLVTTSDGLAAFARKVIVDVNVGRDDVPLLYGPIYDTLSDDGLPRNVSTNLIAEAAIVFLRRYEGGEVRFGTMTSGTEDTVPIVNYSAGFEYTRENLMYDESWAIDRFNKAFGRAYNALLNHIHLGAIDAYSYGSGNLTAASAVGTGIIEHTRQTLIDGLTAAADARRPASVLLTSGANRYKIQDAIERRTDTNGNVLPGISDIDTLIFYDGYSITVGNGTASRTYTYPGITANKAYLIRPKAKMIELVKTQGGQDMYIVTGNPDVTRNIEDQIVAHTYRGLYADLAGSVQKLTLPTS